MARQLWALNTAYAIEHQVPPNLAAAGSEETAAGPQNPRKTAGTLHLQQVGFLKHPGPAVFYTGHSNSLCLITKALH